MTTDLPTKDALVALVAALHAKGMHDLTSGLTDAIDVLYPPPPAPVPCPNCHGVATRPFGDEAGEWMVCGWCSTRWWTPARRAPCPTCADANLAADNLRTALRLAERERDEARNRADELATLNEHAESRLAAANARAEAAEVIRDRLQMENEIRNRMRVAAHARAEAAEKRCAAAANMLREWAGRATASNMPTTFAAVIATLEGLASA